jgi:substrate-binding family protein
MPKRPTAVFAATDLMALGAMSAIREAELRIPDDVALVGFDDIFASRVVTRRFRRSTSSGANSDASLAKWSLSGSWNCHATRRDGDARRRSRSHDVNPYKCSVE